MRREEYFLLPVCWFTTRFGEALNFISYSVKIKVAMAMKICK